MMVLLSLPEFRAMTPDITNGFLCNAARLSPLALAAYSPQAYNGGSHWPNCHTFTLQSESVVVVWDDKHVVVAIAGTDDIHNFISNFNVTTDQVGKLIVHKGLYDEAQIVALKLKDLSHDCIIPNYKDQDRQWWFTGHSAGGAKASLLPLCLPELSPTGIYTFASPRCFKTKCVGYYGYNVHRFDNPYDIVPDVPFHRQLRLFKKSSGWSHVGKPVYLKPDGSVDTENGYWLKRLTRHIIAARSLRPSKISRAAIQDHSMFRCYHLPLQKWANVPLTELHSE